jgi:branched-chain amino acid transport system substrate-binding protein
MHKHMIGLACFLTVAVWFAACDGSSSSAPTPTVPAGPQNIVLEAGDPIIIGVSAALSGDQASIGQDLADAVDLAIEDFGREILGHSVKSQRVDDGCSDPEMAQDAAEELVAAHAVTVVGPMCTTGAQAANDVYGAAGVIHITPSATREGLSEVGDRFFFRTVWRDDAQAAVQARYIRAELRAETAVVVDDGEPYGRTLADALVVSIEAAGARVISRERLARGEVDFGTLARQIIAADSDVVVYEGLDPEGALLLAALRQEGYIGDYVGPDSLLNTKDFILTAGDAAEGAILTAGPVADQTFNDRFQARFGRLPSTSFVLQAYDAARVALTAIEAIAEDQGGDVLITREALAEALRADGFAGLTGTIRFDDGGDRSGETARDLGLAIYRVSGGAFEQVE